MPQVVITPEDALRAKATLLELIDAEDSPKSGTRERAASSLIRLYQTQQRYFEHPETEEDYERAKLKRGGAQELETTTEADIIDLQRRMVEGREDRPRRKRG